MSFHDEHWGCPRCLKYCQVTKEGLSVCCGAKGDPSVTTILGIVNKPAIGPWMVKMEREAIREGFLELITDQPAALLHEKPDDAWKLVLQLTENQKAAEKIKKEAGEIGTAAHALIEWFTRRELGFPVPSDPPETPEAAQWAFMAWQDWARKVNLKPLEVELVLYSTQHGYIGTADLIGYVENQLTCVDYKTGKAVYREAHLQNVAYRSAYAERAGESEWLRGLVLRLPKVDTDPGFEPVEVTAGPEAMPAFLGLKEGWTWMRGKELK